MGVRRIDEGYDYQVLVLDEVWIVRIPRRPNVVPAMAMEIELLPALERALPVDIPRFTHVSLEPPFVTYRMIDGEPLTHEDPRAFLDALHAFDPAGLPVPAPDWVEAYARQAEELRRLIVPLLDADERRRAESLFGEIETLTGFTPALTHSDLGPGHLLCRDGALVGVIDWADARIGDPAIDYAWLLNVVFPDWDVDEELRRRARFYHRLGPWFEAHYGAFTSQPDHLAAGLAGIRTRL